MYKKALISLLLGFLFLMNLPGFCDCGSVPFAIPVLAVSGILNRFEDSMSNTAISYDPLKVRVIEPGQRAIILWNGIEEILLLSTDQSATENSAILEVIPLPSEPKVRLGSLETFEKAQKLIVEKQMWACAHGGARADMIRVPQDAGRITFHQKLGPHDVSVAQVLDGTRFVDFVQSYLTEKYKTPQAPIRPEFVEIIQSYIDSGFKWFVFDVIALDKTTRTREPIEYRFKSDFVFYPMKISNLEEGETLVDLTVFTQKRSAEFIGLGSEEILQEGQYEVGHEAIRELDESWEGFFSGYPTVIMDLWKIKGNLADFKKDVIVK